MQNRSMMIPGILSALMSGGGLGGGCRHSRPTTEAFHSGIAH